MKNNNELKPLFRNVDIKVNPVKQMGGTAGICKIKSFYNDINESLIPNLINSVPVNTMDVDLIRGNLCRMFGYRVESILKDSISVLEEKLNEIEFKVYKFLDEQCGEKYPHIRIGIDNIYNINEIVKEIIKDFPYIKDLMFYFDINEDFEFIKTLALAITSKLYNMLTFHIGVECKDIFDKDMVEAINECINSTYRGFTNFLIENLVVLINEARTVYFSSGDFVQHENGNIMHYTMQDEYINTKKEMVEETISEEEYIEQKRLGKLIETLEDIF